MSNYYKVRAFALGENACEWLSLEEEVMSNEQFAIHMGIDPRVITAIEAEKAAFRAHHPLGGVQGVKKWRESNPERAALIDNLD